VSVALSTPAVAPPLAGPTDVTILVGGTYFQGWQTAAITVSCETMPNSFSVSASTEFFQGPALAGTRPGQSCQIFIGQTQVINGWIDRRVIQMDAGNHMVTISGRGITRNLVDCSADLINDPTLKGGTITASSIFDLAQRLSKAYGITVTSPIADRGQPIPGFRVGLGETPYQIIESAARYARFLVYEDSTGNLVLDQVGTKAMASGFSVPGIVEQITAEQSVDGRYSEYVVVWNAVDSLSDLGGLTNQATAPVFESGADGNLLGEFRLRIIVSEQIVPGYDFAAARAKWEMARRLGRSQAVSITCDTWYDLAGERWTPNRLAPVDVPDCDIVNASWIIGTVTYRLDASGTHADVVLMPPNAFQPEPEALVLFDAELSQSPRTSGSPAPPQTNP
jgi:prophage tail gpP-like protein